MLEYLESHSSDSLRKLLRHELVHALFAEKIDKRILPSWFNEGVAMFLECNNGCQDIRFPAKPGKFLEKADFLQKFTELRSKKASILYAQSLFMIQTMVKEGEDSKQLRNIIKALNFKSDLTSDAILSHGDLSFDEVYKKASKSWAKKRAQ